MISLIISSPLSLFSLLGTPFLFKVQLCSLDYTCNISLPCKTAQYVQSWGLGCEICYETIILPTTPLFFSFFHLLLSCFYFEAHAEHYFSLKLQPSFLFHGQNIFFLKISLCMCVCVSLLCSLRCLLSTKFFFLFFFLICFGLLCWILSCQPQMSGNHFFMFVSTACSSFLIIAILYVSLCDESYFS